MFVEFRYIKKIDGSEKESRLDKVRFIGFCKGDWKVLYRFSRWVLRFNLFLRVFID